jgi:hypothetical protein
VPTLGQRIVDHLRTKGASLDDGELADALGVRRPEIAEACRALEAQGLVVRDMAGGTRPVLEPAVPAPAPAPAAAAPPATAPPAPVPAPSPSTQPPPVASFADHARQVLSARWGTVLQLRLAAMPGGEVRSFELVSGNGRIVGDVVWLAGRGRTDEAKSALISESVLIVAHVTNAVRRFLVFGEEWDAVNRWVTRYRLLLDGVELWFLDGDRLERLA